MNYADNTLYTGAVCLKGDKMYKLTIKDRASDGMCCDFGDGTYSYTIDGVTEFDANKEKTFTDQGQHIFYVGMPTPENNGNLPGGPMSGRVDGGSPGVCGANEQQIRIVFVSDIYAAENSWELRNMDTNRVVRSKGLKSYANGSSQSDTVNVCVPHGNYRFTLKDGIGDGICCGKQGDGRYELYMDGELMVYGSDFTYGKVRSHDIIVGYDPADQMTQREVQYLNCHNWRRKKYHEDFGASYRPLKYDLTLAADAQHWADELLNDCAVDGIKHEPGVIQGENLAKNVGNGSFGQLYPVENICRRWFEREEKWPYPDNAHFTQGLWRSANYVGCAESVKSMSNGATCRIQVCRYARAGNCNMGQYKATIGDNWKVPMLQEHNPCGPPCPPGGCH